MKRSIWALTLISGTIWGCASDGTKTGNGVTLEFAATQQGLSIETDAGVDDALPPEAELRTVDSSGTVFTLERALLGVTQIELRTPSGVPCEGLELHAGVDCDAERLRIRQDFELDLLRRRSKPSLDEYRLPPGIYERLDISLDELKDSELGRATLLLEGRMDPAGRDLPFVLTIENSESLRFENTSGVNVDDGESLLGLLDVQAWFSALPITSCLDADELELQDGILLIEDADGCSEIEAEFIDALRASTELTMP